MSEITITTIPVEGITAATAARLLGGSVVRKNRLSWEISEERIWVDQNSTFVEFKLQLDCGRVGYGPHGDFSIGEGTWVYAQFPLVEGQFPLDTAQWEITINEVGPDGQGLLSSLTFEEYDLFMELGRWATTINGRYVRLVDLLEVNEPEGGGRRWYGAPRPDALATLEAINLEGGDALELAAEAGGPARRVRAALRNVAERCISLTFEADREVVPTGHDSVDRTHGQVTAWSRGSQWDRDSRAVWLSAPWADHVTGGGKRNFRLQHLTPTATVLAGRPERGYTLAEVVMGHQELVIMDQLGTQCLLEQFHEES